MTELCPECSQTLEVAFVELHTRVETTGCVTCAEALARFVRAAAAVEVDEGVSFDTVPISGFVRRSGLAEWREAVERAHAMELAEREVADPLNDGAYGPDAILLGLGELAPIAERIVRDPYLGDSIENIIKREIQLKGKSAHPSGRKSKGLNSLAKSELKISSYVRLTQKEA